MLLTYLQMNSVLKEDFEKKMTVVGLLKQYAQQRDVETFARGLSVILSSANHQPLLQHIRLNSIVRSIYYYVNSNTQHRS